VSVDREPDETETAAGPVVLDERRGMMAQKATEVRRHLAAFQTEQAALRRRQAELEKHFLAAPATTWEDAAEKARYLIALFAATSEGRDPRRQKIIASVLDDFARLAAGPGQRRETRDSWSPPASGPAARGTAGEARGSKRRLEPTPAGGKPRARKEPSP
jgi:hypothetical protein